MNYYLYPFMLGKSSFTEVSGHVCNIIKSYPLEWGNAHTCKIANYRKINN